MIHFWHTDISTTKYQSLIIVAVCSVTFDFGVRDAKHTQHL